MSEEQELWGKQTEATFRQLCLTVMLWLLSITIIYLTKHTQNGMFRELERIKINQGNNE